VADFICITMHRKLGGYAAVGSAEHVCTRCTHHKADKNSFSLLWCEQHKKTHRNAVARGAAWLVAPNPTQRNNLVTDYGYRYSPFVKLPYYHMVNSHADDLFHNILEGLLFFLGLFGLVFFPSSKLASMCYLITFRFVQRFNAHTH